MLHSQAWTNCGPDADGARSGSQKVRGIITIIVTIITIIINIIIVIIVKVIIIILIHLTSKIYNSAVNQKKNNANKIRRKRILM